MKASGLRLRRTQRTSQTLSAVVLQGRNRFIKWLIFGRAKFLGPLFRFFPQANFLSALHIESGSPENPAPVFSGVTWGRLLGKGLLPIPRKFSHFLLSGT